MTGEETNMNCGEFEELVHDLDRPGTQGLELRERALLHAEFCSRCALLVTENESLDYGLHALALQDAERKAAPNVEAAVLREFRRGKVLEAPRTIRWQFAVIGAAAIALLAVGVTLRHQAETNSHGSTAAGATAATSTPASLAENASAASGKNGDGSGGESPSISDADESEYATAFVPLPYADDLSALDGGAVVRVMLSRAALTSLGLPETEMGGAERIRADLVVSDDGTPQAIRLVSQTDIE
jgi:hypothetical protein